MKITLAISSILLLIMLVGVFVALQTNSKTVSELNEKVAKSESKIDDLTKRFSRSIENTHSVDTENKRLESDLNALEKTIKMLTLEDVVGTRVFTDDKKSLSFEYPKRWGEVIDHYGYYAFSGLGDHIVFAFSNPFIEDLPARDGYWGDEGFNIKDAQYIEDYCNDKENCEVFSNTAGTRIASHTMEFFDWGYEDGSLPVITQYYTFNPYEGEAKGLVISPIRVELHNEIKGFYQGFEAMVDSIEFFNKE